jgi:UDP-GlcNAc:undecaprenyl-phosphate GlcNAc-1-phosphate transferase
MSVFTVVVPAVTSFILCLLLTPWLRNLAIRLQWVDRPDLNRKLHKVAVPRLGGVPVVVACLLPVSVFVLMYPSTSLDPDSFASVARQVLPASFLVFLTGLLDDLTGLRPSQKLGGQILAAAFACLSGVRLHVSDGLWGGVYEVILTCIWLVACSNAFNLIDGVDGLATGLGFISTLTMFIIALMWGNLGLAVLTASMASSLLAFLYFNFSPASIFLGDSGSLWTGFMLGCFGVLWPFNLETLPAMFAPVILLSIPLADTTLSIARRFVSLKPVFSADHGHIHHRLLARRLTPRNVSLCLYGAGVIVSCLAVALSLTSAVVGGVIAGIFCIAAGIAIRSLVFEEFRILGDLLRQIRSTVKYRLLLTTYETRLREAAGPEACWFVLRKMSRDFGFTGAKLQLGGRCFEEQFIMSRSETWSLRIPVSPSDYLNLRRRCDAHTGEDTLTHLVDMTRRTLSEKAAAFQKVVEHEVFLSRSERIRAKAGR